MLLIEEITYSYNRANLNSITKVYNPKRYLDIADILQVNISAIKRYNLDSKVNIDLFIKYFIRYSNRMISLDAISKDRKLFISIFTKLRQTYQDSDFSTHIKLFRFPPVISYYINRIRLNNSRQLFPMILKKLLKYSDAI